MENLNQYTENEIIDQPDLDMNIGPLNNNIKTNGVPNNNSLNSDGFRQCSMFGNRTSLLTITASVLLSSVVGFGAGYIASNQPAENVQPTLYASPVTVITSPAATINSMNVIDVAALSSNSVVEITTEVMVTGTFMQQAISNGAGSGVIITTDGYIVTNNHVIADATKISVRLKDGTSYNATLIGTDQKTDIALLKINATKLQAAVFGDSSTMKVGETVVAIGNPLGQLGGTVTDGIISALDREITIDNETMRLLQTNAAINPGNSGGGLFNLRGELIGIVNAKSSGTDIEGLGFAIPANVAKDVIEDLMAYGYVKGRVYLGVNLLSITNPQSAMIYRVSEYGVYIQEVQPNSAAKEAGLQAGDRIVSFQGKTINSYVDFSSIFNSLKVGDKATIVISRNKQNITYSVTLKEYVPVKQ